MCGLVCVCEWVFWFGVCVWSIACLCVLDLFLCVFGVCVSVFVVSVASLCVCGLGVFVVCAFRWVCVYLCVV